jgi:large subunit ribosomal protein L35Ae
MKGTIVNFRSSAKRQTTNQMVIIVDGIDNKEKAETIVGKNVVYKTEGGKEITGKVTFAHGNSGAVRVLFERGMPGQAISKKVDIN